MTRTTPAQELTNRGRSASPGPWLAACLLMGMAAGVGGQEPSAEGSPEPQPPVSQLSSEALRLATVLVTTEGQRIPIRAPFEVVGSQVRYTSLSGTLTAIPVEAIDLTATAESVAAAQAAAEREEAERRAEREAILPTLQRAIRAPRSSEPPRLTLDDTHTEVGRWSETDDGDASEDGDSAEADGSEETEGRARPADASAGVEVASWNDAASVTSDGGPQIYGVLRNSSERTVFGMSVEVRLLDAEGAIIGRQDAVIPTDRLRPGESSRFSALFASPMQYDSVEFSVR